MAATILAKIYMESFFRQKPLEEMKSVLADNLQFSGSFYKYDTADDYIKHLQEINAPKFSYKILKAMEKDNTCCLVYRFTEDNEEKTMAQLFEVEGEKIIRIRLMLNAEKLLLN